MYNSFFCTYNLWRTRQVLGIKRADLQKFPQGSTN
jgi:hypothetical protein